jgi:hypothetical protein
MGGLVVAMWADMAFYVLYFIFFYIIAKNVFLASWEIVVLLLRNNKRGKTEPEVPAELEKKKK